MKSSSLANSALIKIAATLTADQLSALSAEPATGGLSELLMMPAAYRRAGRARAVAEAADQKEIPLSIKHPLTSRFLSSLGSGLIGGSAGAVIGSAVGPAGAVPGAGIGGLAGAWLGALIDSKIRKGRADQIFKDQGGKPLDASKIQTPSAWASLAAGVNSQGRADVAKALTKGQSSFAGNPAMSGMQGASLALANLGMIPGLQPLSLAAQAISVPQMVGSASLQRDARRDIRNAQS